MKKVTVIAALAFTLFSFIAIESTLWSVDAAHSRLGFSINHLGLADINGDFKSFDSKITATKADFSDAVVELSADVATINTGNEMRDGHLKGADFFDVEKFPKLTFKSTSFKKGKGNNYILVGDLTLHGVTKPVTLNATYNGAMTHPMSKKEMTGFKVTGKIKRSDFAVAPEMSAPMLADDVYLHADLEFAKN